MNLSISRFKDKCLSTVFLKACMHLELQCHICTPYLDWITGNDCVSRLKPDDCQVCHFGCVHLKFLLLLHAELSLKQFQT